jgi:hypothetical protein
MDNNYAYSDDTDASFIRAKSSKIYITNTKF